MRAWLLLLGVVLGHLPSAHAQLSVRPRSDRYRALQQELARGWNTWSTHSVLTHVLLPEGVAVNLSLKPTWLNGRYLPAALPGEKRPEKVRPGLRSNDGRYTSLDLSYAGIDASVESATDGDDLVLLVRATLPEDRVAHLAIDAGLLWGRPGSAARTGERLVVQAAPRTVDVGTTGPLVTDVHLPLRTPYLTVRLGPGAPTTPEPAPLTAKARPFVTKVGIFTGKARSLAEIEAIVSRERTALLRTHARWGDLAEPFAAMQTVLAWNVIYDPEHDRVISPVSRTWNVNFGGYVLFDWDTYFAAAMYGLFDKRLAYANAVEISKSITARGFVPNFASAYHLASFDRSQPPVGSRIVLDLYRRHGDRWLLEEVWDELIGWNRWWPKARANRDWLSWGTHADDDAGRAVTFAKYESGLDNAPMFDGVPLRNGLFELADVGLTSLYVMDCDALAEIAAALGKRGETQELRARAEQYRRALRLLWNEEQGLFLDRRTDTGQPSPRLSPTHFYPLLARAPTQAQAERMARVYFDPKLFHGTYVMPSIARNDPAFKDNDYWRGRIWAPMNYLVYLGLRNYRLDDARRDLVARSRALLLKSWRESRAVYENYNAVTGVGGDVPNADSFYHWGALLGFLSFLERPSAR